MWVRPAVLAALVAVGIVLAVVVGLPDIARLRADVAATGRVAPVLFVLGYAVATLAPLPRNVLSILAGILFGLATGLVVVMIGTMLGAAGGLALARWLGRDTVELFAGDRLSQVDEALRRRGLHAVMALRLLPMVPFTLVSYAAGLTAVGARDYLLGTALGVVPGTLVFVALGAYGPAAAGFWPLAVTLVAVVGLTAGGTVLTRRFRRRGAGRSGSRACWMVAAG